MAVPGSHHTLRIKVLENSARCSVFVVRVCCGEPRLLRLWCQKQPFCNGQVQQTGVSLHAAASEVRFVLQALHRAADLPNNHYWGPFVLELCLDALPFHFRLPDEAQSSSQIQAIMEQCGELTLLRLDGCFRDLSPGFGCLCVLRVRFQLCTLARAVVSHAHPPWPAMQVRPKTDRHNITGLAAHTIVGRAQGALRWPSTP